MAEGDGGMVWIGDRVGVLVGVGVGVGVGGAGEIGLGEEEGNGDGTGGRGREVDGLEVRRFSTVVWRLSSAIMGKG